MNNGRAHNARPDITFTWSLNPHRGCYHACASLTSRRMQREAGPITEVTIRRSGEPGRVRDAVAVEEPLEIRVEGAALAVVMRTPGDDAALTAGFLLTEGVIEDASDLAAMSPCRDPNRPNAANVYLVSLAAGCERIDTRLAKARRAFFTSSSCGLCGKATIDNLMQDITPHPEPLALDAADVTTMGELATAVQPGFRATGGLHGAAIFRGAELQIAAEDVGRHNAVDKVLGRLLLGGRLPLRDAVLWVSGRASFEIVQKALVAGVRGVVCVGAPTSMGVDLARRGELTLIGFVRGDGSWNAYHGPIVS